MGRNEQARPAIEVELQQLPVVDSFQEATEVPPQNPSFASDRNMRTQEQTSPDRAPLNVPQKGGDGGRAPQKSKSESPTKSSETVFSLNSSDLLKDKKFKQETLQEGPKQIASQGFVEKLKKGEQLKVNAQFFDYGNYINRMRTKIAQRWNPHSTLLPEMYRQRTVRVDLAVVLNRDGEIVELYTLGTSRYDSFDQEAIRSIKNGSPYPNPPKSLVQEDGLVYMPWSFVMTMDSWGVGKGVE